MKRFLLYSTLAFGILAAPKVWAQTATVTNTVTATPTATNTATPSRTPTITPTYTPSPFPHNETIFGAYPYFTFTNDPNEIAANTYMVEPVYAPGVEPGDFIKVYVPAGFNAGLDVDARITVNNRIDLIVHNNTGSAVDAASTVFFGQWHDRTVSHQRPLPVYTFRPSPTP